MRSCALAVALLSLISLMAGCGGGGGGTQPTAPANSVVIKSVGAATTLYGVGFKLQLPPGVTLATQGNGALAAGALVSSGGAADANFAANYDSGVSPQTVTVSLTKASGFPVGEFMTVIPVLAQGTALVPGDFVLSDFKAYDNLTTGSPAPLITGTVTAP